MDEKKGDLKKNCFSGWGGAVGYCVGHICSNSTNVLIDLESAQFGTWPLQVALSIL